MQNQKGLLLVIEGVDGSGKSTQFKLLNERLRAAGYDVVTFKFPRYDEPSSYFVRQYLDGVYGGAEKVGPYTASLFYALDRFSAAAQIRAALAQGKIVLVDRYTGSNMAHQGTKFYHADQRRGYFIWLDNLEYEMLRIPRPDINFVMHVPIETSQKLLTKTNKKRDIHEVDAEHLKRSIEVFNDMCQLFPKDYMRIDCVRSGQLLSINTINNLLWEKVSPMLPEKPKAQKASATAEADAASAAQPADNPYIEKTAAGFRITQAGRELLTRSLTDTQGNVYALKNEPSSETAVAAFAYFTEHAGDMRTAIAQTHDEKKSLLSRDDRIKRLAGAHIVIENGSSLLMQKLEQGRLGAYIARGVRYESYDQKDEHGQYKYFTPEHFSGQVMQSYRENMDLIFGHYARMVQRLTDHLRNIDSTQKAEQDATWEHARRAQAYKIASAVLPIAAKSTVGIFASAQAIEQTVNQLLSDALPEARDAGRSLLVQARHVLPMLLKDADKSTRGGAEIAHRVGAKASMAQLADTYLPDHHAAGIVEPVVLTNHWPRNELDLVPDILYEHSNLSLNELRSVVDKWPYQQKTEVFRAYLGERSIRPGRALEQAYYNWDIVCDYATFRDLLQYHPIDDSEIQELTPRYGYEVPGLIEDAGLADIFEACFDISLNLHGMLQANDLHEEAQYVILRGHRLRWKAAYDARQFLYLQNSSRHHPAMRALLQQMHAKLTEVHPLIGDSMNL